MSDGDPRWCEAHHALYWSAHGCAQCNKLALDELKGADQSLKKDAGKPPLELLPGEALAAVARVLDFGRRKYEAHGWRKGMAWGRVAGAALRHIYAWLSGENKDPETGEHPLAHAACEVLFGLEYALTQTGTDDRYRAKDS